MSFSDDESVSSESTSDSRRHARLHGGQRNIVNNKKKVNKSSERPTQIDILSDCTHNKNYDDKNCEFDEEEEKLQLVYRNNEKEDSNENTQNIVRRELKNRVWPHVKFVDSDTLKMQELFEQGNILNELLIGMNKTSYSKCERARFWNTYRPLVVESMSILKSTTSNYMRMTVLKGKNIFINKFKNILMNYLNMLVVLVELKGEDEEISNCEEFSLGSQGTTGTISTTTSTSQESESPHKESASNTLQSELEATNASNPVYTEMEDTTEDICTNRSNSLKDVIDLTNQEWKEPSTKVSEMNDQEKMIELIKRVCGKRIEDFVLFVSKDLCNECCF